MTGTRPTLIGSVQRALRLVDEVGAHGSPVPAKMLAKRAGQPLPTTYHLLRTLVHEGYLQRVDGGYVLGERLTALSCRSRGQLVATRVRPILRSLHEELRMAVYLAFLDDGEIVLSEVVDSPAAPRVDLWVGFHDAAHATALGKCVLASLPEAERRDYLARHEMPDLTPRTITDPRSLLARLDQQRGHALDREEYAIGTACLGSPVVLEGVRGALAVSFPVRRLAEMSLSGEALTRAAGRISVALGA